MNDMDGLDDLGLDLELSGDEYLGEEQFEEVDPEALSDLTEEEKELFKKVLEKQQQLDPIMEGFKGLKDKPSDEQIESWKGQHGKVYTIGLNDDEFFVFRSLRRLEWRNLMKTLAQQPDESRKKEAVCQRAVLWPKLTPEKLAAIPAGTPDTIYEMVLQASNFLMPQEALACVRKL